MIIKLLCAVLIAASVFDEVKTQASLGTLGLGLLSPAHLQTGGLLYPNPDGSGPQADSLAAAIYGVAIPPGFGQFSASDNYFGGQGGLFPGGEVRAQPSDLLVGTGLHLNVRGGQGGDSLAGFSPFISDFSSFGGLKAQNGNSDLNTAQSSLIQIDPIAARFGAVIPNDNLGSIFHPSLSGTSETSLGATSTSTSTSTGASGSEFTSPVETSIRFDLPTQVTLPQGSPTPTQTDFTALIPNVGGTGTSRSDGLPPPLAPSGDLGSPSNAPSSQKANIDIVTTAFKFSDDQITKTEEMQRNFEQASGKFTATIVPADFEVPKSAEGEANSLFAATPKTKDVHNNRLGQQRNKEVTILTKGQTISKTPSPYTYRGNQRDRQLAQQSKTSTVIIEPPYEEIPIPEALNGIRTQEFYTETSPEVRRSITYAFMMAPGYHTPN